MRSDHRHMSYRKIPKMSPGAYIFQRPFLKGLYSEGLMYGGKFAFKSRLCQLIVGRKFTIFSLFYFVFEGTVFKYKPPGAYIRRGHLTEGFLHYRFGKLMFEGAYFRNFTVFFQNSSRSIQVSRLKYPICIKLLL